MAEETKEQVENRNPDGTFKVGHSGNPQGRPKNTLKEYLRQKLSNLTSEEKEKWLVDNKIPGELQFRMAEGNPHQATDVTSGGETLQPVLVKFLNGDDTKNDQHSE